MHSASPMAPLPGIRAGQRCAVGKLRTATELDLADGGSVCPRNGTHQRLRGASGKARTNHVDLSSLAVGARRCCGGPADIRSGHEQGQQLPSLSLVRGSSEPLPRSAPSQRAPNAGRPDAGGPTHATDRARDAGGSCFRAARTAEVTSAAPRAIVTDGLTKRCGATSPPAGRLRGERAVLVAVADRRPASAGRRYAAVSRSGDLEPARMARVDSRVAGAPRLESSAS